MKNIWDFNIIGMHINMDNVSEEVEKLSLFSPMSNIIRRMTFIARDGKNWSDTASQQYHYDTVHDK